MPFVLRQPIKGACFETIIGEYPRVAPTVAVVNYLP